MTTLTKKVFALWESIDEMAADLGESPNLLRRQRDLKQLPDSRHDQKIVVRARALGKRITYADLAAVRAIRPEIELADRSGIIKRFFKQAGGYKAVSDRTGVGVSHLRANASRGWLNKTSKHEYLTLAQEINFDLPMNIFDRPLG